MTVKTANMGKNKTSNVFQMRWLHAGAPIVVATRPVRTRWPGVGTTGSFAPPVAGRGGACGCSWAPR
jgi:hypothetical protein